MNPLEVFHELQDAYRSYVETYQTIRNDRIRAWLSERIEEGRFLWRAPYLTLGRRFQSGESLNRLVDEGLLHPRTPQIFRKKRDDPQSRPIDPYRHQSEAWRRLLGDGRNCVVATGTGSGKSFCFAVPVVSEALRANEAQGVGAQERRGVRALLIYPMNALANSQYEDLAERLHGTGLTICNYTADLRGEEGGQRLSPRDFAGGWGWMEIEGRKLTRGMFVARVVGESMNWRIPNGAYCIFRSPVEGSRNGRVLLVQHRDIADPEQGGQYTVKVYESEKKSAADGGWRHSMIRLKPDSTDPAFQPIVLRDAAEDELAVIAELVEVIGS